MDIQCPHCKSYLNIREIYSRCTECKKLINQKTNNMKATLENFLVKWDGNNPLWKELIDYINGKNKDLFDGSVKGVFYGVIDGCAICVLSCDESYVITLEQWKELLTKTETMKNNFKKGDKVFVAPYGWCEYCEPSITVRKEIVKQGCNHYEVDTALVSFTEYKLEGFTQERPFEPVINENYFFWNDGMLEKHMVMYGKFIKYQPYEKGGEYVVGSHAYKHISETNPLL